MFELWFTLGLHFLTLLAPLGDHLEYQGLPWTLEAALSPKVQNVCKRLRPNPKGVILGDQFWHFFCIFFK